MKQIKIKKTEVKTVVEGNMKLTIGKGYCFVITKGKDGNKLEKPISKFALIEESYYKDEETEVTYRESKRRDGSISYIPCDIIDVCELEVTRKDGDNEKTFKKFFAAPEYLVGKDEATIKNFLAFKQL